MKNILHLFRIILFGILLIPFSNKAQNLTEFWGMTNDAENGGGLIFKTDGNGDNQQVMKTFIQVAGQNPDLISLCQAANGKLYGMTYQGGMSNVGVLYEYDYTTNKYTKKLDFVGAANGANPHGSLIKAASGKLYGLTLYGGANNVGVLFEYDPTTNVLTKKYDFNASASLNAGYYPYGSLIQASNGKLYGMTYQGGVSNMGVVFEYNLSTSTYSKKIDFAGTTNGSYPLGNLMQASGGKLYGMTTSGGANTFGVLFEYNIYTSTYTKRIDFAGTTNGANPYGTLLQNSTGKLYGMTYRGGTGNIGVLFEYDTTAFTITKKLDFSGAANGSSPLPLGTRAGWGPVRS